MAKKKTIEKIATRAPIVSVMGHIDHGKSTLLDYIRKANTVDGEAGGITQHVASYEAEHNGKKIVFIDTPGHEAFAAARERGAKIADIAILVVAADDGVSAQTLGALKFIRDSKTPFVVAINKIDKANADIEKTKSSLLENEVYLEGMGGDISYTGVSALKGSGISDLLDTVLLLAEVEDYKTDIEKLGSGFVLESGKDSKKGIYGSLILKEGSLKSGNYIVSGYASSPVRIMEDYTGKQVRDVVAASPIKIIGFDSLPGAGDSFGVFENKKEAIKYIEDLRQLQTQKEINDEQSINRFQKNKKNVFPLVLNADVAGSIDAIKYELSKIEDERSEYKIIHEGCGSINEKSIKAIGGIGSYATIIGFNVSAERNAVLLAENLGIELKTFSIIYELIDYLKERIVELTPKEKFEDIIGEAKILKVFSWTNKGGVVGGEVISGNIAKDAKLNILRRGELIGSAKIKEMQSGKKDIDAVEEGVQFGVNVVSRIEITEGDVLQASKITER